MDVVESGLVGVGWMRMMSVSAGVGGCQSHFHFH